eukprot:10163831-Lingulodinium_polyedra.AAC.1
MFRASLSVSCVVVVGFRVAAPFAHCGYLFVVPTVVLVVGIVVGPLCVPMACVFRPVLIFVMVWRFRCVASRCSLCC